MWVFLIHSLLLSCLPCPGSHTDDFISGLTRCFFIPFFSPVVMLWASLGNKRLQFVSQNVPPGPAHLQVSVLWGDAWTPPTKSIQVHQELSAPKARRQQCLNQVLEDQLNWFQRAGMWGSKPTCKAWGHQRSPQSKSAWSCQDWALQVTQGLRAPAIQPRETLQLQSSSAGRSTTSASPQVTSGWQQHCCSLS